MKKCSPLWAVLCAIAFVLFLSAAGVNAATFTVTNTADSGTGSLRQAIVNANLAAGSDLINFSIPAIDTGCSGGVCTITLTSDELRIIDSVTINGTGARNLIVQRSSVLNFRIFTVLSGTVLISGMKITGGSSAADGGGIIVGSTANLTLNNVQVHANAATGTNDGGGIYNLGTLTLTNSTIVGNTANGGGGIYNFNGTLSMTNSTVSGNMAVSPDAGGVYVNGGTCTLTHVTISRNSAFNGSGVGGISNRNGAVVNLRGSIIAQNPVAGNPPDLAGAFTSQGFNVVGNKDLATGLTDGVNNDRVGSNTSELNSRTADLGNFGGQTDTHPPYSTSPAIDKISGSAPADFPANDQRGVTRPVPVNAVLGADSGAVELRDASFSPGTLPNGNVGQFYDRTITATGDFAPFTFSVTGGSLPSGLTLDPDGRLSGTPTITGNYIFTVAASGSFSAPPRTFSYGVRINQLNLSPDFLPTAYVGVSYNQTISLAGGSDSYTYAVTGGALPAGLTLNPTSGVLSGTPTARLDTNFDITATDTAGGSEVKSYSLLVRYRFSPATLPNAVRNQAYNQTVSVTGVTSLTFSSTGLPGGLSIDSSSGVISGTPTASGSFSVTVTATKTGVGSGSIAYNLFVASGTSAVVTKTADTNDGICNASDCSLREAIAAANTSDTVTFNIPASDIGCLSGVCTINLTSGELPINKNLIINGTGARNLTVRRGAGASSDFRVFNINTGFTAHISGLTISGGRSDFNGGGGILNNGTLTLTNSHVAGNTANPAPGYMGGGLRNNGTLTVERSTISGNAASDGGGIYNAGALTLINTTFSGNTATNDNPDGRGGAVFSSSSQAVRLTNITITNNTADAAGSGIYNASSPIELRNSIAAQNAGNRDVAGSFLSLGNNLVGLGTGASGFIASDQVGTASAIDAKLLSLGYHGGQTPTHYLRSDSPAINRISGTIGVDFPAVDQRGIARPSGATADVGAVELVQPVSSIIISPTSLPKALINASYSQTITATGGSGPYSFFLASGELPVGLTLSTGGVISGTPTMLGIYNFRLAVTDATNAVTVQDYAVLVRTLPIVTNTSDDGVGSLRRTIGDSDAGETVTFNIPATDAGCTGGVCTITLTSGELFINKNLTIDGTGVNNLIVRRSSLAGTPEFRIFEIASGTTAAINGLTISGGLLTSGQSGGGILNAGVLLLTDSTVSNNSVSGSGGGGIENTGTLTLTNSTVNNNSASNGGGGIWNFHNENTPGTGTLTLTNSTVSSNSANAGGGIYDAGSNTLIINSTVSDNSALGGRGGIHVVGGSVNVRNTIVAGNTDAGAPGPDVSGAFSSNGNNLIGDVGDAAGFSNGTNNDIVGGGLNPVVDARLAPLGNYGGATLTYALLLGSPAINAGDSCVTENNCSGNNLGFNLATDQRGALAPRKIGSAVDIGAFESSVDQTASSGTMTNGVMVLPGAFRLQSYSVTLSGSRNSSRAEAGGIDTIAQNFVPFTFQVLAISGQGLPASLTLDQNTGVFSGVPTTSGVNDFTIKATDSDGMAGVQQYRLTVLTPTAAEVMIAGRVMDANGRGLYKAVVSMTDAGGNTRTALTNPFGYYRFFNVQAGEAYIISVSKKRFQFESRLVSVSDEFTDLDFTPLP